MQKTLFPQISIHFLNYQLELKFQQRHFVFTRFSRFVVSEIYSFVSGNLSQQNSLEESKQLLHCDKLRAEGFDVDGSYSIEIDGSDAQVFCEFHSDGQNWLVRMMKGGSCSGRSLINV